MNLKVKNWNLVLWTWIAISKVQKVNLEIQIWEVRILKVAKVNLHEYSIRDIIQNATQCSQLYLNIRQIFFQHRIFAKMWLNALILNFDWIFTSILQFLNRIAFALIYYWNIKRLITLNATDIAPQEYY